MCTQQCDMRAAIILTVCNRAVYIIYKFIYMHIILSRVRKFSSLRMFRN